MPYAVGDHGRSLCATCRRERPTTYAMRPLTFEAGTLAVPEVLVAVCDVCDTVAAIPAQSTPVLRAAFRTHACATRATRQAASPPLTPHGLPR